MSVAMAVEASGSGEKERDCGECWDNRFMKSASVLGRATRLPTSAAAATSSGSRLLELSTTSLQEPAAEHSAVSTPPDDKKLLGERARGRRQHAM